MPYTKEALIEVSYKIFNDEISEQIVQNLIGSMNRRMQLILASSGDFTKY